MANKKTVHIGYGVKAEVWRDVEWVILHVKNGPDETTVSLEPTRAVELASALLGATTGYEP